MFKITPSLLLSWSFMIGMLMHSSNACGSAWKILRLHLCKFFAHIFVILFHLVNNFKKTELIPGSITRNIYEPNLETHKHAWYKMDRENKKYHLYKKHIPVNSGIQLRDIIYYLLLFCKKIFTWMRSCYLVCRPLATVVKLIPGELCWIWSSDMNFGFIFDTFI